MRWLATRSSALLVDGRRRRHGVRGRIGYFYHPYFEGATIPPLPYGLALGLVLGVSVARSRSGVLFPAAERRAQPWVLASAMCASGGRSFLQRGHRARDDGVNRRSPTCIHASSTSSSSASHRPQGMDRISQRSSSAMAGSALVVRRADADATSDGVTMLIKTAADIAASRDHSARHVHAASRVSRGARDAPHRGPDGDDDRCVDAEETR